MHWAYKWKRYIELRDVWISIHKISIYFFSEPDKIDIYSNNNKDFVFELDIWIIHNWDQPVVFKRKNKSVINKLIMILSLIYSNTSIIIVSGPLRWKKNQIQEKWSNYKCKWKKSYSIHRYGIPCNLIILNKNLIINSICCYVTTFIRLWCCNS